jgi:hypothetical protein
MIGEIVGKNQIKKIIGRDMVEKKFCNFLFLLFKIFFLLGSFSAIYMAIDCNLSEVKAIKCFFKGDEKVCDNIYFIIYLYETAK